jgi:hypothetical protein
MANTYTIIASNTLSTTATTVTFSSIPTTYTDLVIRASIRNDGAALSRNLWVRFNGSSATNYSYTQLIGTGTTASSNRGSSVAQLVAQHGQVAATATSNTFSNVEIYIPNYNNSTNKVANADVAHETSATTAYISANGFLRSVTDAITSIDLVSAVDNFVSGSSFFLYGIKNS